MGNFYTDVLTKDHRFTSTDACRDTALLEPVTRAAVQAIINEASVEFGINLLITETFRSSARQQLLFSQQKTQLREVGVHNFGLACDFCKLIQGKAVWSGDWNFLAILAEKYGMISGVNWGQPDIKHSFVDSDHIQRIAVSDQQKLFSGLWYPDESYKPGV